MQKNLTRGAMQHHDRGEKSSLHPPLPRTPINPWRETTRAVSFGGYFMARAIPSTKNPATPQLNSFKSVPEQAAPRRAADRRPAVMCEAQQQSTTVLDTLAQPHTLSLVRRPTVGVSRAFTTDVDGDRRDVHISSSEPSLRHIVVHGTPVGQGGQSVVYAATNAATGASLVYKQLRSTDMRAALAEALHEANIAKAMDSPMAPMVIQQDDRVGLLARAMPTDLLESIKGMKAAPWSQVRTLALDTLFDLAGELKTLHAKGYLHCDIKAGNVLVDENRRWKLADFGHATRAQDFEARKQTRGTMAYWAPEVFQGEPFSEKSDTYSLGLLYLTVLGRGDSPMFTADFIDQLVGAPNWEAFIDGEHKNPGTSAWMVESPDFARVYNKLSASEQSLVRLMLHYDPTKRPNAEQLLKLRNDTPALQRNHVQLQAAYHMAPTDAFEVTHTQRMREVLKPLELQRHSSYGSFGSDSDVSTPRTPTRDERPPTHRRR